MGPNFAFLEYFLYFSANYQEKQFTSIQLLAIMYAELQI